MDKRTLRIIITKMNKSLLISLLVILFSSCSQNINQPLTEKEVLKVMEQFDRGWKTKNPALVDSSLSPQYLYFTPSGKTFDRAALIATAGSTVYTLQTMERDNLTLQIEGNTAVVNTIWKGKGIYHGESFDDRQRCSVTVTKWNGKVRILSEHCTPIR